MTGITLLKRIFSPRLVLLLAMLPVSAFLGGCVGPCGAVPVVLLPLIVPPALIGMAIDDQPGWSNTDFVLAGRVVDERGQPVEGIEARITAWTSTRRSGGYTEAWKQRDERHTLGRGTFRLKVNNAQTVEMVLHRDGYRDEHLAFAFGVEQPPSIHVRRDTLQPGEVICTEELEDGGVYHNSIIGRRPFRDEDLDIVMARQGDG